LGTGVGYRTSKGKAPRLGARCRERRFMDPQGWWGVLLQGTISAVVGGIVTALTAWAVVAATRRHDRHSALHAEARAAAVRMFHMTGELHQALQRALVDDDAQLPNTDDRDWLVNATSLEIAMFAFDGTLGARISQDVGDLRRALESLNTGTEPRTVSAPAATACLGRLADDLADWLMDGRHRAALQPTGG
jgi:hypothetical protein